MHMHTPKEEGGRREGGREGTEGNRREGRRETGKEGRKNRRVGGSVNFKRPLKSFKKYMKFPCRGVIICKWTGRGLLKSRI